MSFLYICAAKVEKELTLNSVPEINQYLAMGENSKLKEIMAVFDGV